MTTEICSQNNLKHSNPFDNVQFINREVLDLE